MTAVLPKRVPTKADTDRLTRTINDLRDYVGAGFAYLPLTGGTLTGPLLLPDGSAANPAWAFSSDPNTGARWISADEFALVVGALDALILAKIGSSVGVGILAVPSFPLHVEGANASARLVSFKQTSGAGASGLYIEIASTGSSDPILRLLSNGTVRHQFGGDGAFTGKGGEAVQKVQQAATASADLTLTAGGTYFSFSPACSVALTPGNWTVWAVWHFVSVVDVGTYARGILNIVSGSATIVDQNSFAQAGFTVAGYVYQAQAEWKVTVTAAAVIEMQALKLGGGGTSYAAQTYSRMVATYSGNPV